MAIVNSLTTNPLLGPDHTHLPITATETWVALPPLPDHPQLPESDGMPGQNFPAQRQSVLLTTAILPVLQQLHPDDPYCISPDSGIDWQITEPPLKGCGAPDWFYVPPVSPLYEGQNAPNGYAAPATQPAEQATQRADRGAARWRQMGIDPNDV
jgi:hypothetical protein